MGNKQKLELTWIGKNNPEYDISNIEPRILEEDKKLSYGAPNTENMIIHGDNLLAIRALLPEFESTIKCVYIDPPYNTGSAFDQYDDSVEHSLWLSLMKVRLEILYMLLKDEGVIYIHIDDREQAYLKILCDQVFSRKNFVCSFIWKARSGQGNTVGHIAEFHEYILCYAKDISKVSFKKVKNVSRQGNYKDAKGFYKREQLRQWGQGDRKEDRPTMHYPVEAPDGMKIFPKRPDGTDGRWRCSKEKMAELIENNDVDFIKDKNNGWICHKKIRVGRVTYSAHGTMIGEVGTASTATKHLKEIFNGDKVFDTPKPEDLVAYLVSLATEKGDFVLDSFAGSGTTGAVSQKLGRNWIIVEIKDHCYSVIVPRLKKVIDGIDQGGISKNVSWNGGGGFKFYKLAPSFIVNDEYGNPVIDSYYNDAKLIKAMCKLMNYVFQPSQKEYWKHGKGQGSNSLFVTTQLLSVAMVQQIARHLSANETLLICPKKYEPGCEKVDNRITIKKIPQSVLKACQFGKKEYLLPIKERAIEEIDEDEFLEEGDGDE